ncbi:MAG: hypothetical protein WDW38_004959 [Sanguina aurantia]
MRKEHLHFACRELQTNAVVSRHAASLSRNEINNRPMIGILSQPGEPAPKGMSYIAASYIKWVESAGARAVPILYDMSEQEIKRRFSLVNGILLPGGGANLSPGHPFYDTARLLVDLAVEANENGDYFPVHGTCLGMETLAVILSGNYSILTSFDAENSPVPLLFTDEAESSHLIQSLPEVVVRDLQNSPITMENHMMGLSMASYQAERKLKDFFSVLSLSIDNSGNPYISTIEARKYPITATQWHPEKNAFEWHEELDIPHSPSAVRMSQAIANFFVSEARRNMHKARNAIEEDDVLIYNWKPFFTGKNTGHGGEERDFAQCGCLGLEAPLGVGPAEDLGA